MAEAVPRSAVGNQAATTRSVAGEDGRLCETGEEAEGEDGAEDPCCGEIAGESDEEGADGPEEDAYAVDAFGAEAVEEAS